MDSNTIDHSLRRGIEILTRILGHPPTCSAVPGWKCNDVVLMAKNKFLFEYNSDCRGESIFRPIVGGREIPQPQIPVTLPTYDEVVGRNGVTHGTYNDYMLTLLDPQRLNVLTVHAEVEGITCLEMFEQFLKTALSKGSSFVPLGVLLREYPQSDPTIIVAKEIPGREGWVSCQAAS
jgi:undecaprenyl phosphate-alpha-L-ara4FN deformylase